MHRRCLTLCVVFVQLVCAALPSAADAASSVTVRPFVSIQSMLAPRTVRKLYVVDLANSTIDLFPAGVARPKQIGTIAKGVASPTDAFVDAAGTLYVANMAPASITEYAAGNSVPQTTLSLGKFTPLYITAGPDGTVYVMAYDSAQHWRVIEFDRGARKPSRVIVIPYETPYSLTGGGIAVDANNLLYVNTGSVSAQGDFFISVYLPKHVTSTTGFTSGGYAAGGVQVFFGQCFVGDPGSNNIEVWHLLPVTSEYPYRVFKTESAGDYFTLDVVSNYLYAVSYATQTLQIYDFATGRLLNFMSGFSRGVAIDPAGMR